VFEAYGEAHLVLTKRPETMPSHQGEIVFPGGGVRADDATALDAALRETEEEVGIPRSVVEVAAELDSIATFATRFTITPFVGLLDPLPELVPHPREVVEILEVPLSELLADETFREERWSSRDRSIFFFELPGETVWGATARILVTFLSHLTRTA
jgi:8-oxo-dGTP pyrophosphatase MutT (NUDIX family)